MGILVYYTVFSVIGGHERVSEDVATAGNGEVASGIGGEIFRNGVQPVDIRIKLRVRACPVCFQDFRAVQGRISRCGRQLVHEGQVVV